MSKAAHPTFLLLFHFRGAHLHVTVPLRVTSIVVLFHARKAQFQLSVPIQTLGAVHSPQFSQVGRHTVSGTEGVVISHLRKGCSYEPYALHRNCSFAADVFQRSDPSSKRTPRSLKKARSIWRFLFPMQLEPIPADTFHDRNTLSQRRTRLPRPSRDATIPYTGQVSAT